jgi:hypothetical protein
MMQLPPLPAPSRISILTAPIDGAFAAGPRELLGHGAFDEFELLFRSS